MAGDKGEDELLEVVVEPESAEEVAGGGEALDIVSGGADDAVGVGVGGAWLAEVVAEDGGHEREVVVSVSVSEGGGDVEGLEGVFPDVALGVPEGCLLAADGGLELGIEARPAAVAEKAESERGALPLEEELLPFVAEPLAREAVLREGAAELDRLGGDLEFESGDELHEPEDAEGILGEVGADVAQHAPTEVVLAVPGVDELAGERVAEDGVDGEVAAGGRLGVGEVRVGGDGEVAVPGAQPRLAAGQGHVDVKAVELDDAEGGADLVKAVVGGEKRTEDVGLQVVDLDVDVLGGASQQGVAHTAANQKGTAARRADELKKM